MTKRGWPESEEQAEERSKHTSNTAFLNASLLLILNVCTVWNFYTGTENKSAHRPCTTVLHDMQIIDENCSTMAGIILD